MTIPILCNCSTVEHIWAPGETCPPTPLRPPEKLRPDAPSSQDTPRPATSDPGPFPTTNPTPTPATPTQPTNLLDYATAAAKTRAAFPAEADEFAQLWAKASGYIAAMFIRPGFEQVAVITETVMCEGEILIAGLSDIEGVHERFHYPSSLRAASALMLWAARGFEGEPDGWVRHKPSFRRRPGGDPALEYVGEDAR